MGRDVRRVPVDFDWPLNTVWEGYRRPEWRPCPSDDCDHGSTVAMAWLSTIASLLLMVGEAGVNGRPLHPWLSALPLRPSRPPGPQAAELSAGLAGRPPRGWGHDAIDRWAATAKLIEVAGLPAEWGICPVCHGHGIHPEDIEAADAWQRTDPPAGDGWQLWETTSEGSPITPVFQSAQELAEHAAAHCILPGGSTADVAAWQAMIDDGFIYAEVRPGLTMI